MNNNGYYVLAFESTHYAIRAESLLKRQKVKGEMIPTPREIDASCGLSIRFSQEYLERVMDIIDFDTGSIKLYWGMNVNGKTVYMEKEYEEGE